MDTGTVILIVASVTPDVYKGEVIAVMGLTTDMKCVF